MSGHALMIETMGGWGGQPSRMRWDLLNNFYLREYIFSFKKVSSLCLCVFSFYSSLKILNGSLELSFKSDFWLLMLSIYFFHDCFLFILNLHFFACAL